MIYFTTGCSLNGQDIQLPELNNNYLYYRIADDCMRIEVCGEIEVPVINIRKSFSAYVELDPCRFMVKTAFEKKEKIIFLFDYDWGRLFVIF